MDAPSLEVFKARLDRLWTTWSSATYPCPWKRAGTTGALKVPSNPNGPVILQPCTVKRNRFVNSNVSPKRSQPALSTVQVVKISCYEWNAMQQPSWAVSITVYEFVLNTHAVNNILLVPGMLLNCFQRPPFSLHLTGLETPGNSYRNYPQSHAKIHLTLRTLKNSNQKYFPNSSADLSMNEKNGTSERWHEWGRLWVSVFWTLWGVTRFRDSLPWAVPGPRQSVSSMALLCIWFFFAHHF